MKTQSSYEHIATQIYRDLCLEIGSEYAKSSIQKFEQNGLSALTRIDPSVYTSAAAFSDDWMLQSFLSKYEGISDVSQLSKKAEVDFLALEAKVLAGNRNLRQLVPDVEGILSAARRKIEEILERGSSASSRRDSSFPFQELYRCVEWGPGATSTLNRSKAYLDKKMLEPRLTVTHRCLPYAQAYIETDLQWLSARLGLQVAGPTSLLREEWNLVDHDVFDTVVKSFKQRRVILKQPTMNLFFQKAVGKMIRRRLKREKIDLDDQSRNQRIARRAFIAQYATIDLASASDSLSLELVALLLPPQWYEVLADFRTSHTMINGKKHKLEKFSAMGNGFTFELESLIFYALSWAVVRAEGCDSLSRVAVYGDDIIVKQRHSSRLIFVLESVGFEVNRDKSFVSGHFFESCGKHYFDGSDVTPIYQKEIIADLASGVRAHNRVLRWCARSRGDFVGYDKRFQDIVSRIKLTCEGFLISLNELRHTKYLRLGSRRGKPSKRFSPILMPVQPGFVEGDGALIGDPYDTTYQFDIHGVARMTFLRDEPIKVESDMWALLATALRRTDGRKAHTFACESPPEMGRGLDSKETTVKTFRVEKVYQRDHVALAWVNKVH